MNVIEFNRAQRQQSAFEAIEHEALAKIESLQDVDPATVHVRANHAYDFLINGTNRTALLKNVVMRTGKY